DLRCVKGSATVSSASGSINLIGVGGDVDASTASGEVIFKGALRAGGHYRLKSISGEVEMTLLPDAPGFTATLMSYSGEIETDVPLKRDSQWRGTPTNHRITGRYGDGQTQITLDSFRGTVRIAKGTPAMLKECK